MNEGRKAEWLRGMTWRAIWRRKIGYSHSLTNEELVGHIRRMQDPEANRCAYGAFANAFNLKFALHEMRRRGLEDEREKDVK